MQALVLRGVREIAIEELPEPRPEAGEVLIEVAHCCVCGSDLHGYLGHSPRRTASLPLVMGHEFTGHVAGLGAGVEGLAADQPVVVQPVVVCGQCRACQAGKTNICPHMQILGIEQPGAFARFVCVPADRVFPLPDGCDLLAAAATETLAVEVHAWRSLARPLPRLVVVLGAGAQGLLALQLAKLGGADQVIVSELLESRLELARQYGAASALRADRDDLVAAVMAATDNWGAELVLDAVGASATHRDGLAALAPGGTLIVIGLGAPESALNLLPLVGKEQNIRGSYCYRDDDFLRALELIADGRIRVAEMIQSVPLQEGAQYFERLADQPEGLGKVVLHP